MVISSITNWDSVTDEEYDLLYKYISKYDYVMLERVHDVPRLISNFKVLALADAEKHKKELELRKNRMKKKRKKLLSEH